MSSDSGSGGRSRRALALRALAAIAFVVAIVWIARSPAVAELATRERLIEVLEQLRAAWWSPLALVGLYVFASITGLPVSPILFAGGAVFGFLSGVSLNILGLFLGAAASFGLGHLLGRDLVVHFTGPKLRRAEKIFARRGFWPLVQTRFLPFPFALVNYGCALAGVTPGLFLGATLIGLIPSTAVHTYFCARIVRAEERPELIGVLVAYAAVLVAFNMVLSWPTIRERRRRKRRYAELLERRRSRSDSED